MITFEGLDINSTVTLKRVSVRVIIYQVVSSVVDHWSNCSFRSQVLILYTKLTGA